MKKKTVIFLLLGGLILALFNRIMMYKVHYDSDVYMDTDRYEGFYMLEKNSIDYLILGNSHALTAVNPMQVYAETGFTGYHLGNPNQSQDLSYHWLLEAYKTQSPQYVFLDVGSLLYADSPPSEEMQLRGILYMKPSLNKWNAIKRYKDDKDMFYTMLFPLYRFHARWDELEGADFSLLARKCLLKGAVIIFDTEAENATQVRDERIQESYILGDDKIEVKIQNEILISPEIEESFKAIYELCMKNGSILVPIKFPTQNWDIERAGVVTEFLDSYNLRCLDMTLPGVININWALDTYDSGNHINYYGMTKTTVVFSQILKNFGDLNDHRADELYQVWGEDLAEYRLWEQEGLSSAWLSAYTYLYALRQLDHNFLLIVSAQNEMSAAWNPGLETAMKEIGSEMDFYDKYQYSYIGVFENGGAYEKLEQRRLSVSTTFVDENGTDHIVEIESGGYPYGCISSVKLDGAEYSLNLIGLNIIVINKMSGEVVSSVNINSNSVGLDYLDLEDFVVMEDHGRLIADGVYNIVPIGDMNYGIDARNMNRSGNIDVILNHRNTTDTQSFKIDYIGNGVYTIRSMYFDKYLAVENGGSENESNVVLQDYTGLAQQKWVILECGKDKYQFISLYNQLALDVPGGVHGNGTNIHVWEQVDIDNQKFICENVNEP